MDTLTGLGVLLLGLFAGLYSAVFGMGGGLVIVPGLVVLLGFEQHVAQGMALIVVAPTAFAATLVYHSKGHTDWQNGSWIALGGIIGAVFGSLLAHVIPADILRHIFGLFLIGIFIRLLRNYR